MPHSNGRFELQRLGAPDVQFKSKVQCGNQNDGSGQYFAAVAHTDHGDIPGKAKDNTCWYPYSGKEEETNNFSWVVSRNWHLVRSENVPNGALQTGHQNDGSGELFSAVAHTEHGDIPGKAKDRTCWYPYQGSEHLTDNFSWVCNSWDLVRGGHLPEDAIRAGHQNDGAEYLWCVVGHGPHGDVPGKGKDNTCWYPYGGSEVVTQDFSWIVSTVWRLEKGGVPPLNAILSGHQNDGAGDLWAVVAHTPHGDIPGKAKDNICWYPYAGKEELTHDFSWVVCN